MKKENKKISEKNNRFRISHLKTYFLIVNILFAVVAFSYLVSAEEASKTGSGIVPEIPPKIEEIKNTPENPAIDPAISSCSDGSCSTTPVPGRSSSANNINNVVEPPPETTVSKYSSEMIIKDLSAILVFVGIGALIGSLAGGDKGTYWGTISGLSGGVAYAISKLFLLETGKSALFNIGSFAVSPLLFGVGVGTIVFILTYKTTYTETVEFKCLPYQPPIGGGDCELCNNFEECSEYTCKSLGQACELVNKGTGSEKCIWANPKDVNSPIIKVIAITTGYVTNPFNSVRPPAAGVEIKPNVGRCVKAFTPLEFAVISDEPAQCKIDYNLTSFDEMSYYVGGDSLFNYSHNEKMSLPGPDSINAVAPELKNDGIYTLFMRCRDANGNTNENAYAVRFCVEPGPDTTAPVIVGTSIPSGNPIQYNQTFLELEVYVNEPSDCKWSRDDKSYDLMETSMTCVKNIWEMNSNYDYTCRTTLTGIEDRKENKYYFRCKDQPNAEESSRNVNTQSYVYTVKGTQPLNIIDIEPKVGDKILGATDSIPVFLKLKTDNGYNNGEANCYYYNNDENSEPVNEEDYIEFLNTGTNQHEQRQDLATGDYTYYFKCIDLGGNADYNSTSFRVESDRSSPSVMRVYKESGNLKIITNENADCSYSFINCNFEISDGIKMESLDYVNHEAEWRIAQKYYIRCKDKYDNQPSPNSCSIIVKPYEVLK